MTTLFVEPTVFLVSTPEGKHHLSFTKRETDTQRGGTTVPRRLREWVGEPGFVPRSPPVDDAAPTRLPKVARLSRPWRESKGLLRGLKSRASFFLQLGARRWRKVTPFPQQLQKPIFPWGLGHRG